MLPEHILDDEFVEIAAVVLMFASLVLPKALRALEKFARLGEWSVEVEAVAYPFLF